MFAYNLDYHGFSVHELKKTRKKLPKVCQIDDDYGECLLKNWLGAHDWWELLRVLTLAPPWWQLLQFIDFPLWKL